MIDLAIILIVIIIGIVLGFFIGGIIILIKIWLSERKSKKQWKEKKGIIEVKEKPDKRVKIKKEKIDEVPKTLGEENEEK